MAKGGGQREGGALKTAVVVTGGLVLAWLTVETAFKPFLDRLRAAVSRSTNPSRDPDEDPAAAVPDEDKGPASATTDVGEEKEPAFATAEPSAPPLPAEEDESERKGEGKEVELGEKEEGVVAAKAQ
ncbi:uncharacterized protein LOC100835108 [Brachypodium distachyon]|uniref:Outer envelope membrane protein 7 n=1 Tax=Brachypodium distachyon TaxID=15368 RepID=I1ID75_BRADI|nr:uncharacterized protein LOC100835108 [Brachypodium distachyon]KQK00960.2 hypothetical protein BRADI_3g53327v3 [Brachypodium distachyon]|eukprot:XP_003570233.1 uncharacterized protein LOC100835108 [Brachypodium distachyon]